MRTQICGHPQKEAVSGSCSEQDDSASGSAWLAREPQLMYGAKGRASSQRSIDYHNLARSRSGKIGVESGEGGPGRVNVHPDGF
jgi:hypothetical protein